MTDAPAPANDDDGGVVGRTLVRLFGRSYRTTLAGVAALVATVVPFVPGIPGNVVDACHAIAALAAGAGLLVAKDGRVSGVSR